MTLIGLNPKKCAVCGHEGKFPVMHSYTIFENSDLDGRPGEMLRGTMWTWVERCLNCNYCGRRIEHVEDERFTQMVYEASYQQLFQNVKEEIELVVAFKAASYLQEKIENWKSAAKFALYNAWIWDDEENEIEAIRARKRAIMLLEKVGPGTLDEEENCLLADLYRRVGDFGNAMRWCDIGLKKAEENGNQELYKVLTTQKELALIKDQSCYKRSE